MGPKVKSSAECRVCIEKYGRMLESAIRGVGVRPPNKSTIQKAMRALDKKHGNSYSGVPNNVEWAKKNAKVVWSAWHFVWTATTRASGTRDKTSQLQALKNIACKAVAPVFEKKGSNVQDSRAQRM
eukprot:9686801-Alexandrium_andersonii.AAC.1